MNPSGLTADLASEFPDDLLLTVCPPVIGPATGVAVASSGSSTTGDRGGETTLPVGPA